MTAASANKVTVPGDNRLDELKLGNKTPFWHKIPIIKELRVAVGWQKGMLITGLVLTAFFLLVAIFAPLIAPYSYAQLKGADGVSFPAQAAPSSEHIWGTTAGGYDVFSRVVWGARTAVIAIVVAVLLSIFAGVLLGLVSGYFGGWVDRVLVMIADAVYSFPSLLLAILMAIMISHGQSGLWSGIFASGISITAERQKKVLFTEPFYESGLSILISKTNAGKINNFADLKGKTIAVQIGTTAATKAKEVEGATIKTFNHAGEAILELANGGADAVLNDKPATDYMLVQQPALAEKTIHLPGVLGADPMGMAVSKNNPTLQAELNKAMADMKASGEYQALYKKYFGDHGAH